MGVGGVALMFSFLFRRSDVLKFVCVDVCVVYVVCASIGFDLCWRFVICCWICSCLMSGCVAVWFLNLCVCALCLCFQLRTGVVACVV